jgi:hypothetical protein
VNDLPTAIGRKERAVKLDGYCSIAIARLSNRSLIFERRHRVVCLRRTDEPE